MHVAVIGFIMVLMMRFLAAIIVWLIVVLAAVGSIGLYTHVFAGFSSIYCVQFSYVSV